MSDRTPLSRPRNRRYLRSLLWLSILALGSSQGNAQPEVYDLTPESPLAQGEQLGSKQQPSAKLDQVLRATHAKLEELSGAIATLAADGEVRKEIRTLKQENELLIVQLQQASARHTELESSNELAAARIAELSKAVDAAAQEAALLDEEMAGLRQKNSQLEEGLVRAHAARADSEAKEAELPGLREELEATRQELATAASARQQVEARVGELEEVVNGFGVERERLKTQLAEVKEQLGQAVGVVVQAEQARQAASSEAEWLRAEAKSAREELTAATADIERFKSANTELRQRLASWQVKSRSAVKTARFNLILMEEKIEQLNAALAVAQGTPPPSAHQDPADAEGVSGTEVPSTMAPQPPRAELAAKTDFRQSAGSTTELPTYPIGEQ